MINEVVLTEQGYLKYPSTYQYYADILMQKGVQDHRGVKYYIDMYRYPEIPGKMKESWKMEVTNPGDQKMVLQLSWVENILSAESLAEKFWRLLCGGQYYKLWEKD